jgi:signal transduction histidine kinase
MVPEPAFAALRARRHAGPRAGVLVALLALTLALATALAYEAHDAARSHRATAERALRDYAYFAAYEILAGARDSVHDALAAALSPVTEAKALSPYEALPPPAALARTAAVALRCERPADDSARFYFRLDLRDGALATSGAAPAAPIGAWVADTVGAHVRAVYKHDWRYAVIFGRVAGEGLALVYGVKYAEFGAPIAAFGFTTCPSAFGVPLFRAVVDRHAIPPSSVAPGVAADSLLSVTVLDAGGREVYRSSRDSASAYAGEVTLETLGGLTARVALRAAAVERLPVPMPRARVPLLVGLLALTAALVVIAVLQLRRESELARLRADFTSSVSHELRTPLAQIVLFAETLHLGRVRSAREQEEAAGVILQEARRLMHLVENVLFFSRAERRANHPLPRATRLEPRLVEIVAAFAPLAEQASVDVTLDAEGDPVAAVDPDALRQMVLNLLDNAAKYGPAGQTVTVGARTVHTAGTVSTGAAADERRGGRGGRVRVWVEDQGPGIPPHDRERVWLPFLRLRRDRNGATGGSGIGLAVVRELAELHGGAVWVEGGAAGGARFVIDLPAADAAERDGPGVELDVSAHDASSGDASRLDASTPRAWGPPPDIIVPQEPPDDGTTAAPDGSDERTRSPLPPARVP